MLDYWEDQLKTVYEQHIKEDYVLKGLESFIYQLLEEQKKRDKIKLNNEIARLEVYYQQCIQQLKLEMEAIYIKKNKDIKNGK